MGQKRATGRLAVVMAVGLVLVAVSIRAARSGPAVIDDLKRFRSATQLDVGPNLAFFGAGLDGDGQAYAVIATDPLGLQENVVLYRPDFRYARSGFAWLGAALAFGVDGLLLAGIAAAGMLSIGMVGYIAVRERERLGAKAWWLIANPALFLAFMGDTAESLAILLLVLALLGGRVWSALSLAVVRPSYLLALSNRWRLFVPAVVLAFLFRLLWMLRFGEGVQVSEDALGLPFRGFLTEPTIAGFVVIAAAAVTIVIGLRAKSWSWILAGLLVVCLSDNVYLEPINAIRAAGMLPVLWAFGSRDRPGTVAPIERESVESPVPEPVLKPS